MIPRAELMEFIDAEKTSYGVRRLCRVLGVSKSAYYEHHRREGGPSPPWAPLEPQEGGTADAPGRHRGRPPSPPRQVR